MTTSWPVLLGMGKACAVAVICLGSLQSANATPADGGDASDRGVIVGCCIINGIPAPECIPSIEEADCLAMGGLPNADVDCATAPCDLGACCLEDLSCQDDMSFFGCRWDGQFMPGATCAPDTCANLCPNDQCVNSIDLNATGCSGGLPCTFATANFGCERRPGSVNCQVTPGGPIEAADFGSDKWYTWTPQPGEGGTIVVDMCDAAAYDALAAVHEGGADCSACPINEADTLACNDDGCGIGGGPPIFHFDAVEGHCYFLRIGGWNGEQGSSAVTLKFAPCNTKHPMPGNRFDIQNTVRDCTTDADCTVGLSPDTETTCINGWGMPDTCYVHKNRYVSIDPNPENGGRLTARRISLDLGGGISQVLGWVGPPVERVVAGPETSPQLLSRILSTPHYRDWSVNDQGQPWTDATVNVGDCATSPGWTYVIESIDSECNELSPNHYSHPLVLPTVDFFGDVAGAAVGQPPEQNRSFKDISALAQGFQGDQKVPAVWLDLVGPLARPECPDFADLSFVDINVTVSGFQGGSYPYPPPTECPPDACPYP